MNKFLLSVLIFCLRMQAQAQSTIPILNLDELKNRYTQQNDTTYIVNFFATWCGPCIQEMPMLNKFYEEHRNTNIQLIFISLDNPSYIKKLPNKMQKLGVQAPVYLLKANSDYSWLPQVDSRWQGSIPATMIINTKKNVKAFFETPMDKGQLEFYLKKLGL